jgi:hypothetical protein
MIRQNIILGDYTYIADLFVAGEDKDYIPVHKKFVMIRNTNVLNDIVYDTEVYFIEKEIIDECLLDDGIVDPKLLGTKIAFPIIDAKLTGYSSDYKSFNDNFSEDSFRYGIDISQICDKNYNDAFVTCDRLRIYFPVIKPTLNAIVSVSTYISNVKFYFVCRPINKYSINSETEFTFDHTSYSEFVDIYVPNTDLLFKRNNLYAIETSNINEVRQTFEYEYHDKSTVTCNITLGPKVDDDILSNSINLSLLTYNRKETVFSIICEATNHFEQVFKTGTRKFKIDKETLSYNLLTISNIKTELLEANEYADIVFDVSESKFVYFFTVNYVYNFDGENDYELIIPDNIQEFLISIQSDNIYYNFEISNLIQIEDVEKMSYVIDGEEYEINVGLSRYDRNTYTNIIELQTLVLPFSIEPVVDTELSTVRYKKVFVDNNKQIGDNQINASLTVVLYPYSTLDSFSNIYVMDEKLETNSDTFTHDLFFDLGASIQFNVETGKTVVKSVFTYPDTTKSIWESYCEHFNVSPKDYLYYEPDEDSEDYDIETTIELIGYKLEISSDKDFSHIVYNLDKSINMNTDGAYFIDNFEFDLSNIFDSWDNIPNVLTIRTMFIDKLLRNTFVSNVVYLSKEKIKYLINDETKYRTLSLVDMQADVNAVKNNNNDMDLTKFNFIDKITCVVHKEEEYKTIGSTNSTPKIIYKPVFYRVTTLQNIKIKAGLNQNIGINLSDLMTKVETFKLIIEDVEYIESARNDVYVIFTINAGEIKKPSGIYSILNQDDEFISTGSWVTY